MIELGKISKFNNFKPNYSEYKEREILIDNRYNRIKEVLNKIEIPDLYSKIILDKFYPTINNFRIIHDVNEIKNLKKGTNFIIYIPEEWKFYDEIIGLKIKDYLNDLRCFEGYFSRNELETYNEHIELSIPMNIINNIHRGIMTDHFSDYLIDEKINHLKTRFNDNCFRPRINYLYISNSPYLYMIDDPFPLLGFERIHLLTANYIIFITRYLSKFYSENISDATRYLNRFLAEMGRRRVLEIRIRNSYDFSYVDYRANLLYRFETVERFLDFGFYLYNSFNIS